MAPERPHPIRTAAGRPRLCILSLSPIHADARVLRQIDSATEHFSVSVVGWGRLDRGRPGVHMQPVERVRFALLPRLIQVALLLLGRLRPAAFERWYWRKPDHGAALGAVIAAAPDLIHANESIALPIALAAARKTGAKVLFDAHEYSLDHWTGGSWSGRLVAPLRRWLVTAHAHEADGMITVAPGLAERYTEALGLPCGLVMNTPAYQATDFRACDGTTIELVHHGVALRARGLEALIETVALCDQRFRLTLMLMPADTGYIEELRRVADRLAPSRVRFREPVAPADIVDTIRQADVGLALIPPLDTSYLHCLPNKFFDFMMAGLAIATGPSPEMAGIVRDEGLGVIAEDFQPESMAAALNAWTVEQIDDAKRKALVAAKRYNAAVEMERLQSIYEQLLADDGSDGAVGTPIGSPRDV